ncbi:hypothetical protein SO802_013261 [Lithocarpus litseifolius]|uniref:Heterokaryon incompatibility domain-containing protein n=1 Tax=Lithocarpus litseifolius TaxID=425828 RepID=A0AAW2D563_9ROSI
MYPYLIVSSALTQAVSKMLLVANNLDDFMSWAGDDQVTRLLRWKTSSSLEEALTFIKDVCIPHPWCQYICIDDRYIS